MHISSPNAFVEHLLESSHRDDSNKSSNIAYGEEITQVKSIEVKFTHLIWNSWDWKLTWPVALVLCIGVAAMFQQDPGTLYVAKGYSQVEGGAAPRIMLLLVTLENHISCPINLYSICDVICKNLPYGGTNIVGPGQTPHVKRGFWSGPTIFVADEHLQLTFLSQFQI